MKLASRPVLLLFCTVVVATVLIFHARDDVQPEMSDGESRKAPVVVASRNLMSDDRDAVNLTTVGEFSLPSTPSSVSLSSMSLKNLLQKSTSRLFCKEKRTHADSSSRVNSVKRTGYILVASFREQQTKASDNLFALQCWARVMLVNIIEPFIENSHFVVPIRNSDKSHLLRFHDIFDLDVWQLLTAQYRFAPLASWETFLAEAPQKLIVVHFKYLTSKQSKELRSNNESVAHFAVSSSYKSGCDENTEFSDKVQYLVSEHGFTVVREVCVNFARGDQLTLLQFNKHLYGGISPETVSVIMEEWRGLGTMATGKRVLLLNACLLSKYIQYVNYTWPSQQLVCDAKRYRQKYLETYYIALMVRTEKILRLNSSREFMAGCLNATLEAWRGLVGLTGMKATFLAMDIGSYGSDTLNKDRKAYFFDLYTAFIKGLFGPPATIDTWESGFEATAQKRDLGYIGSLQKTLAAQSRCIVFAGGGTFQKNAQHIYERVNHGRRKPCMKILHKCSHSFS